MKLTRLHLIVIAVIGVLIAVVGVVGMMLDRGGGADATEAALGLASETAVIEEGGALNIELAASARGGAALADPATGYVAPSAATEGPGGEPPPLDPKLQG